MWPKRTIDFSLDLLPPCKLLLSQFSPILVYGLTVYPGAQTKNLVFIPDNSLPSLTHSQPPHAIHYQALSTLFSKVYPQVSFFHRFYFYSPKLIHHYPSPASHLVSLLPPFTPNSLPSSQSGLLNP